jgi:3-dehydroquinate dehydratase
MEKPLFSQQKLPMLLTSLRDPDAGKTICTMRNAIYDGTDGFLIHLEALRADDMSEDALRKMIAYACDKPLYTMNYRSQDNGKSDEQLMDEQVTAVKAGASMIDMMGDTFDPSLHELTLDATAIGKQRQVIDTVHALGGEVLISSHTGVHMTTDEVLQHARALEAHGADFIKIVTSVRSEEEAVDAMKTTTVVSKALSVPFLHICTGQYGKLHRAIGPMLGCCFALCVQQYTEAGHKEKPLLRAEKLVFDNIDYHPARNVDLGTQTMPVTEESDGIC